MEKRGADTRSQQAVLKAQHNVAGLSQKTVDLLCDAYEMGRQAPQARVVAEVTVHERPDGVMVFTDTISMAEGTDHTAVPEPTPLYRDTRTAPSVCNGVPVRRHVGDIGDINF